jgi:hypothetical protein
LRKRLWAKGYGLGWVELRFVWNKYVTDFTADDVTRAKELLAKHSIKVSVVDSAYFKTLLPRTHSNRRVFLSARQGGHPERTFRRWRWDAPRI